jgi:hypothetical protein
MPSQSKFDVLITGHCCCAFPMLHNASDGPPSIRYRIDGAACLVQSVGTIQSAVLQKMRLESIDEEGVMPRP